MKKIHRNLYLSLIIVCFLLSGCGGEEATNGSGVNGTGGLMYATGSTVPDASASTGTTLTGSTNATASNASSSEEGTVTFGLASIDDPNFSDISSEGLYTIEGGYAYAIDPVTLDKTGPALDPLTKEPVELDAPAEPVSSEEESVQEKTEEEPEEEPVEEETPVEIPESVKLPNTGIFLEDD